MTDSSNPEPVDPNAYTPENTDPCRSLPDTLGNVEPPLTLAEISAPPGDADAFNALVAETARTTNFLQVMYRRQTGETLPPGVAVGAVALVVRALRAIAASTGAIEAMGWARDLGHLLGGNRILTSAHNTLENGDPGVPTVLLHARASLKTPEILRTMATELEQALAQELADREAGKVTGSHRRVGRSEHTLGPAPEPADASFTAAIAEAMTREPTPEEREAAAQFVARARAQAQARGEIPPSLS